MRAPLLALSVFLATPAAAQPTPKDPGRAQLYSVVVPGGGGGLVAAATALPQLQADLQPRSHYERYGVQFGVGLGVAGVLWLYGILDAPNGARRANERNGLAVVPLPDSGAAVAVRIGL